MEIVIRPVKLEDSEHINEVRTAKGACEFINAYPTEQIEENRKYLSSLKNTDHVFVAEVIEDGNSKVVGIAGLHANSLPRKEHIASIGVIVHPKYHRKGIATKFFEKLLHLADNELQLRRVELEVVEDNLKAIEFYKKCGFVYEGTKKQAFKRYGKYLDFIIMARIKNN